jgi:hypothetical protein
MSIHPLVSICLLLSAISSIVNADNALKQYVIRRDFFNVLKAGELSVYDKSEKHLYYRIESDYGILQTIKLISLPSTQVVGRLQAKLKLLLYKAEFSTGDLASDRWINGSIEQRLKLFGDLFDIQWGKYSMSLKKKFGSFTNKFFDKDGKLVAQFRLRPSSLFWTKKYDMKIYSDKYPEQIYLLALAVIDHILSRSKG